MNERHIWCRPWDVILCPEDHPCFLVMKTLYMNGAIYLHDLIPLGKNQAPPGQALFYCCCAECARPIFNYPEAPKIRRIIE